MALVTAAFAARLRSVRIHSQCLTGDVLASERCDCRAQLEISLDVYPLLLPASFCTCRRKAAASAS